MRPCHIVEIVTPKKVVLNGLWFGPMRPKRAVIWVHGLGSSAFSKLDIVERIIDKNTAVLTFNNRGHDKVSSASSGRNKRIRGGAAHENFVECVDDIQGAVNFAKKTDAEQIFLAGHSTGCQKSVYWASKVQKGVNGIILLAPVSDYSAAIKFDGKKKISKALAVAKKMVASKHSHELMSENAWQWSQLADAQRFISLYSGSGSEEIFTYWDKDRSPRALRSIQMPILVLLAEKDEYADRPAEKIENWFEEHLKAGDRVMIVRRAPHSLKGRESVVARKIKGFLS